MDSHQPSPEAAQSQARLQQRLQFAVVILVLALALTWIGVYSSIGSEVERTPRLSPDRSSGVENQHSAELRRLTEQQVQVYGYPVPEPAGS